MPAQGLGNALGGLIRAATESVQARTEQIRASAAPAPSVPAPAQTAPAPSPVAARSSQRRSLVAAKMYLIDMLQLQRHPDAVERKARIQFASGEAPLLEAILDGMRVLLQLTNESYGQRIVARLGEDVARVTAKDANIRGDKAKWQPGKFVHPHDACFDAAGNIFVAEWVNGGRVTKLTRLG